VGISIDRRDYFGELAFLRATTCAIEQRVRPLERSSKFGFVAAQSQAQIIASI